MQLVSLVFTLSIMIIVGLYLYAPFLERRARRVTAEEQELSSLLAERERAINALQELDFDFKLGKVPEEDYPLQRTNLLQKGAEVLKRIDELAPKADDQDARIERALASRRKKVAAQSNSVTDDDIESMLVNRRKNRRTKSAGFCAHCGKPIMASDKFCPSCGKPVT